MSVSIFVFSLPINYNFVLTFSISPTILLSKDSSICDDIVLTSVILNSDNTGERWRWREMGLWREQRLGVNQKLQ